MLNTRPPRFYSLDVLRGFAALSVVLWHWQDFFYKGIAPQPFDVGHQPLYSFFFLFYKKGFYAVQLFFCLSGFIFYWLYSKKIYENKIGAARFIVLRFSRLYPLHFLTLILVMVQQMFFLHLSGGYFVIPFNDLYHFVLNLFMVGSWGVQKGASFNGPSWSLSVEVMLYFVFFLVCRVFRPSLKGVCCAAAIGFIFRKYIDPVIGGGAFCFFMGGCVFFLYDAIVERHKVGVLLIPITIISTLCWTVTTALTFGPSFLEMSSVSSLCARYENVWASSLLFPITILFLALYETRRGSFGKRASVLGDISYSSYLLHFPLQIFIATLFGFLHLDTCIYYSGYFMAAFFSILMAVSIGSYHYIEMPAQRYLRGRLAFVTR